MIRILLKILPYKFFRWFGWPKLLPMNLTVGLTYRCNSQCKTCNIWKREEKDKELTLGEWNKIFKKLGQLVVYLTLSGGEPFLRKDIVEICQSAYKYCRPLVMTIPTNSLLPEVIVTKTAKIAQSCPQSQIIINLSVDGIGAKNDQIRGIKGHYEKVMQAFYQLRKLPYKNLTIGFHTVISKFNVNDFPKIANSLLMLKPDSYVAEIAEQRVELGTHRSKIVPDLEKYQKAVDFLVQKLKNARFKGFARLTQAFRREYYQLTKKVLSQKRQVIPCFAGWASAQIASNGDVWGCCIKARAWGNLRLKVNYDFAKIWFSKKAENMRKDTRAGKCFCPLANTSYTNMLFDLKTLIKVGLNFLL